MKILLVSRGSQGDIYPYLALAAELVKQDHEITINLPAVFEKEAKIFGLNYVLQGGMIFSVWWRPRRIRKTFLRGLSG